MPLHWHLPIYNLAVLFFHSIIHYPSGFFTSITLVHAPVITEDGLDWLGRLGGLVSIFPVSQQAKEWQRTPSGFVLKYISLLYFICVCVVCYQVILEDIQRIYGFVSQSLPVIFNEYRTMSHIIHAAVHILTKDKKVFVVIESCLKKDFIVV